VFFDAKDGTVVQWQLDEIDGALAATELRRFDVGDQVENCVVDGDTLYVGEEDIGVWRYGSSPDSGGTGELIAGTDGVELVADVEGMTIYDAGAGAGWLVVSSQGDNAYALYDRRTHAYGGRFRISGGDIDAASESDGIDVTSEHLPGYPGGLLVAHDTSNEGFTGNFKLVAWDDITATLGR